MATNVLLRIIIGRSSLGVLMSSRSLVACLLACIVCSFSITLTSSNSMVAVLLACIVYSFVDVMGRSPHRQQGHAEVTDATDHAMQRRLINHRSHQHRRAIRLTLHGQLPEPLRPVVLEMSLHTHFIDVG